LKSGGIVAVVQDATRVNERQNVRQVLDCRGPPPPGSVSELLILIHPPRSQFAEFDRSVGPQYVFMCSTVSSEGRKVKD
jgi:hypothetical protein